MTTIENFSSEFTNPKVGETVPEILRRLSRGVNGLAGLAALTRKELENVLEDQGRLADVGEFCSCSTEITIENWSINKLRYFVGNAVESACVDMHEAADAGLENVTTVTECLEQLVDELQAVARLYEECDRDRRKYFELYLREIGADRVRRDRNGEE